MASLWLVTYPYPNEIDIKRPNTQKPLTYEREWLKGENSINIAV